MPASGSAALRAVALSLAQVGSWGAGGRSLGTSRMPASGERGSWPWRAVVLGPLAAMPTDEQARRSLKHGKLPGLWRMPPGEALRCEQGRCPWRKLAGEEASKAFTEAWETARDIEDTSLAGRGTGSSGVVPGEAGRRRSKQGGH